MGKKYLIYGGKKLYGTLNIPCAKNSYLPILASCVLTTKKITLKHFPSYLDTINMVKILKILGIDCTNDNDNLVVNAKNMNGFTVENEYSKVLRSSIVLLGAITYRFKKCKIAYPGGCCIGNRPIDLHLKGLRELGVRIIERHGYIYANGENMHAGKINLSFPSVGATQNLMLASCCLNGTTFIFNGAKEPEIVDLQNFLNKCGAKISGAGTKCIKIIGTNGLLGGAMFTPISDRIIAGTYLILTCAVGGKVKLKNANYKHNRPLIKILLKMGAKIKETKKTITISSKRRLKSNLRISTRPYPYFPTDLQSQLTVLLAKSVGKSTITENLFENRFKVVPELIKMGANIKVKGRTEKIIGVDKFYGADVCTTDLRGGVALVISGLCANGYTTINDIELIDRGYFKLEEQLTNLGADIVRE